MVTGLHRSAHLSVVTGLLSADAAPANHAERVVSVVFYVLSGLAFALVRRKRPRTPAVRRAAEWPAFESVLWRKIIAVVTTERIAYTSDPYNQKMAEVGSFCRFHRVPRGLQEKLHAYFESMCTRPSGDRRRTSA